jgi:hypothetical protein
VQHQIRSLVLYVDLVGSRPIWPAHVGWVVDLVGSRPLPSDRLDDQATHDSLQFRGDQATTVRTEHQIIHLATADGLLHGLPRRATTSDRFCGPLSEVSLCIMCAKVAERWPGSCNTADSPGTRRSGCPTVDCRDGELFQVRAGQSSGFSVLWGVRHAAGGCAPTGRRGAQGRDRVVLRPCGLHGTF